jgi:hypothetical protein
MLNRYISTFFFELFSTRVVVFFFRNKVREGPMLIGVFLEGTNFTC